LGGTGADNNASIQQTTDGGYIVIGQTNSTNGDVSGNHGGTDIWVVKLTATGVISWQKCLGGSGLDDAPSIQQTIDGGYIVGGRSRSLNGDLWLCYQNHGSTDDYWIVKLSPAVGTTPPIIEWQKYFGGTGNELPQGGVRQTRDGSYIVAGYTNSNDGNVSGNHGGNDWWVVKLTP
jgi:hypothetical protein